MSDVLNPESMATEIVDEPVEIIPENEPWTCVRCAFENDSIQTMFVGKFFCLMCYTWKDDESQWGCSYENCRMPNSNARKTCDNCGKRNRMPLEPTIKRNSLVTDGSERISNKRSRSQKSYAETSNLEEGSQLKSMQTLPLSSADIAYSVGGYIPQSNNDSSASRPLVNKNTSISTSSSYGAVLKPSHSYDNESAAAPTGDFDDDYVTVQDEYVPVKSEPTKLLEPKLQRSTSDSSTTSVSVVDSSSNSASDGQSKSQRGNSSSNNANRAFLKYKASQLLFWSPERAAVEDSATENRYVSFAEHRARNNSTEINAAFTSEIAVSSSSITGSGGGDGFGVSDSAPIQESSENHSFHYEKVITLTAQLQQLQQSMFEGQLRVLNECLKLKPPLEDHSTGVPALSSTSVQSSSLLHSDDATSDE